MVALLVGLGVVRLAGTDRATPLPVPTSSPMDPRARAWPADLGSGTLFALDDRGLASLDLSTGLLRRLDVTVATASTLTPFAAGVLVWPTSGDGPARYVSSSGSGAFDVGGLVAHGRRFLPDEGSVWVSTSRLTEGGRAEWRLVDEIDAATDRGRVSTSGIVVGDGAGGMFDLTDFGTRHVDTTGVAERVGTVAAMGPDGYESTTCADGRCTTVVVDRARGTSTSIGAPTPALLGFAALSPQNRYAGSIETQWPDDAHSPYVVRVWRPATGELRRVIPVASRQPALVWASEHWLVVQGRDGLVLYNARDDRVVTPQADVDQVSALVLAPG